MGIFDIFRRDKKWSVLPDNIVKVTLPDGSEYYRGSLKPQKEFRIRTCKECGKSVKHTCISERRKTVDVGGTESISQIWAIANHQYGDRKCRGSNRRYKKQFYK
jgi:hypothetical protein